MYTQDLEREREGVRNSQAEAKKCPALRRKSGANNKQNEIDPYLNALMSAFICTPIDLACGVTGGISRVMPSS